VGLAGAGRAEEHDVAGLVEIGARRQLSDGAAQRALDVEVEVI